MDKNTHLGQLEHQLEVDLVESRRLVECGRTEANAKLEACRDRLGRRYRNARKEIDQLAHDADENLLMVSRSIVELDLLQKNGDMENLEILDNFRDKIIDTIEKAEIDLECLKQKGDAWGASNLEIGEAWDPLSRRLSLVRLHLVTEVGVATSEFAAERCELLEGAKVKGGEELKSDGFGFVKFGKGFEPGLKKTFRPHRVAPKLPGDPEESPDETTDHPPDG